MPRSEARDVPISLSKSLSVIGDPWTLHILKESFLGTRRFQDFQSRLGIPRQTLILRLRQMVINQLYYKKPVQHRRLIFEYRLTPKGVDLYSMILGVWRWHKHWHQTPHHLPEQLIHTSCGHQITPEFVCRSCTGSVKAGELSFAARFPIQSLRRQPRDELASSISISPKPPTRWLPLSLAMDGVCLF